MAEKGTMFLLVTVLVLLTCIVIFAMKYFSAARGARARLAKEDAYRELAERAVKAQEEAVIALAGLGSTAAQIEARLTSVEKVLKEVE